MKQLTINVNDAGQRLDKFLTKYLPNMPQSMLYKSLSKDCVRVNGKHIRDGKFMLSEGDELKLFFKEEFYSQPQTFTPVNVSFGVVYEDENILLINKPVGTVVHTDDRSTQNTLVEQMQSYLYNKGEYNPSEEHSFRPALCNRLDRNTGGIVIAAKNAAALRIINEKLRNREIHKYYICRVEGILEGSAVIGGYLTRGEKKVSISHSSSDDAKEIRLKYKALSHDKDTTTLEIELMTGRTHQIRAQLADIGHPLVNDKKYSGHGNGKYELTSSRVEFAFNTNAGILQYLNGKSLKL